VSAHDFDAVCDGPLAGVLSGLETDRGKAVRAFWIGMAVTAVLAAACLAFVPGGVGGRLVVAVLVGAFGWVFASMPLSRAGRRLKEPALAAIAAARGLTFTAEKVAADGYEPLHRAFGSPDGRTFTDRFAGEAEGSPFAFYEASLVKGSGKSRRTVFSGLIFSGRRKPLQGDIVVVPDQGLFNMLGVGRGLQRVRFEDDPEFEQKYEVYASHADEARAVLNPVVRHRFNGWRDTCQGVTAHIGGEAFAIGFHVPGRDRFEPGDMMKQTPGRERVRAMWDELDSGLTQMREVRSVLG
jgi:hypothetical protein